MKHLLDNQTIADIIGKMPTIKQLFFSCVGVLVIGFLFLSLLSYDTNDPAWSHFNGSVITTNVGGRLGAWVADILRVFFGLGAWWVVFVLGYELIRLWTPHSPLVWQLRAVCYTILLICVSSLLVQWGVIWSSVNGVYLGGVVGFEVHSYLDSLLGHALSALLLLTVFFGVATLSFGIKWRSYYSQLCNKFHSKNPITSDDTQNSQTKHPPEPSDVINTPETEDVLHIVKPVANPVPLSKLHVESLQHFLHNSGLREEILSNKNHKKSQSVTPTPKYLDLPSNTHPKPNTSTPTNQHSSKITIITRHTPPNDDSANQALTTPTAINTVSTCAVVDDTDDTQKPISHNTAITHSTESQQHFTRPHSPTNTSSQDIIKHSPPPPPREEAIATPTPNTPPKSVTLDVLRHRMNLSPIPELSLLDLPTPKSHAYDEHKLTQLSELLEIKLQEFNINAKVVSALVGPVITRFEVELAAGVKVNRVSKVAQDLARSMSLVSLRVLPVIAGKPYIGIEVPNEQREMVSLFELLNTPEYQDPESGISIAIGADISGKPVIADLAKAPHMLVAGTTGSGKSVLVNSFLLSMLLKYTPDELKLVLIDPKQLELANYNDIPHLLTPVITDMTEATAALTWCVTEMERRYQLMSLLRVRKLSEFNKKVQHAEATGQPLLDPLWRASDNVSTSHAPKLSSLPQIVIVADEFADMIMQLGKTAEEPIVRLAQKSRAAGIHLILATQRPVASVVTGLIKSNIPSRVALRVNSATDSRIIIEESGAENMLGHGDMMFLAPGKNFTERVHGAYVKDDEVNRITDAWRERGKPDYIDLSNSYTFEGEGLGDGGGINGDDDYYNQAVAYVLETRRISTSSIQRKLGIGYNRAARIVDMMEERGLVSPMDNSGKRQLLV